jgi:ribonucleoside-triphosphate reductase
MHLTGKALHESEDAYKTGLKIISAMYLKAKELEKETGLKVSLEETPAESASLRLAKVDLQRFPEAKKYVRGNIATGEIYYTNSIHLAPDADVDITERIEKQAKFNTLIESGAITHVFLGEQKPSAESVLSLVKKTWENTPSAQIVISPEFTVCEDCGRISRGYKRKIKNKEGKEVRKWQNRNARTAEAKRYTA